MKVRALADRGFARDLIDAHAARDGQFCEPVTATSPWAPSSTHCVQTTDLPDVDEKIRRFITLAHEVHRAAEVVILEGPVPLADFRLAARSTLGNTN